jgi:5'-nucleotidase
VIHVFNKEISAIRSQPEIYSSISDKRDIILLGDSIGDTHMADGHDADTVLKIGFLTKNPEKNLAEYMQKFDIVLVGDGDMGIIIDTIQNMKIENDC